MTQWDIKPAGYEAITAEQAKLSGMFPLPGAPRAAPMDPSKLAAFITPSTGTATAAGLATSAAQQSKRLYIHNLPSGSTSQEIMEFFNNQMNGLNVVSGREPCLSAQIATSNAYAALTFKAPEDATLALAMNGISMRDDGGAPDRSGLSIRRPKDYITPTADENAYPAGDEISPVVKDSPNKLSIVNIPLYIEEEQIMELIQTMGKLKAFVLVKDTGNDQHRVSSSPLSESSTNLPPGYRVLRVCGQRHHRCCYRRLERDRYRRRSPQGLACDCRSAADDWPRRWSRCHLHVGRS
jgi:splicing factor U2AF subunit